MSNFTDFISSSSSSGGATELGLPFAICPGDLRIMVNSEHKSASQTSFWTGIADGHLTRHIFTRTTLASNSSYQTVYNQTSGGGALLHIICPNHGAGAYYCKITLDGVETIYQVPAWSGFYPRAVFGHTYGDNFTAATADRSHMYYVTNGYQSQDQRAIAGIRESITSGHYISYATSLKVELSAGSAGNWSSGAPYAYAGVSTMPFIGVNK